jgi:hypothetical protein
VEDVPETCFPRHLLDRGGRIGDREEALRRFGLANRLLGLFEEIGLKMLGSSVLPDLLDTRNRRLLEVDLPSRSA